VKEKQGMSDLSYRYYEKETHAEERSGDSLRIII